MAPDEAAAAAPHDLGDRRLGPSRLGWIRRVPTIAWLDVALLIGITTFVFLQLQPNLLFGPNMDVGGDNAAHVAAVAYLVHDLLPHGQVSGWDPQWFGGFPLYVFYFPFPAVLVDVLNHLTSFAVAFKLVSVLGTVTLPAAAYLFGSLAGFRRPTPILLAAAMLPFLFNWSYTIDGGNIASTLAGEFSYSLGCSVGLCFLGCFVHALRTGRLRFVTAILLAVTMLCHVVPALFFSGMAVLFTLVLRPVSGILRVLVPVGAVGGLLAGFWLLPFGADLRYSSSMGYARVGDPLHQMLPIGGELVVQLLAVVALPIAIIRRDRLALALSASALGAALCFTVLPSGIVWNPRWLPFWFLTTALLAGYAVSELGSAAFAVFGASDLNEWITAPIGTLVALGAVAAYVGVLPFYDTPAGIRIPLSSWVSWNYSGYQAKSGWPEFAQLVEMLDSAGAEHGCGRLDYEYTPNVNDTFGSTIVEMSFPMWTNGCIDSEEGVYYESSTSTPFHFLDQSELSIQASNPVVGLPYEPLDVADGIAHLELTGTKYFLADSAPVEAAADADPELVRIASIPMNPVEQDGAGETTTGPASWVLYELVNHAIVTPLAYQPVVEGGLSKTGWLQLGITWYQTSADWPVKIAETGPAAWERARPGTLVAPAAARPLPAVRVSDVHSTDDTVSFRVSRTGVPVLVKVPFFPNWQATGATGPYEVTPNDMVVVPTGANVTLRYGTTTADWIGRAGSVVGVVSLIALERQAGVGEDPLAPVAPPPPRTPVLLPETDKRRDDPGPDPLTPESAW